MAKNHNRSKEERLFRMTGSSSIASILMGESKSSQRLKTWPKP